MAGSGRRQELAEVVQELEKALDQIFGAGSSAGQDEEPDDAHGQA